MGGGGGGGGEASNEQQNPIFSENSFVYRFMERDNSGTGNFEFNTRMQNIVQIYANSVKSPSSFEHVKGGGETCRPRSAESSGKVCYRNLFPISKSIHFQQFYHPEEGWGKRPVVDVRELNQFAEYLAFKMEDISQLKDILWRGDYMTKLDLQYAYLTIPVSPNSKIYLRFFLEGRALSVYMSSIWPLPISKVVHHDIEASDFLSKIYGDSSANRLRQHPHNGRFSGVSCRGHRNGDKGLGISRLHDKKKEVNLEANPDYPVSRFH